MPRSWDRPDSKHCFFTFLKKMLEKCGIVGTVWEFHSVSELQCF